MTSGCIHCGGVTKDGLLLLLPSEFRLDTAQDQSLTGFGHCLRCATRQRQSTHQLTMSSKFTERNLVMMQNS